MVNILDRIQFKYREFSDKEKNIADYILENSKDIKNVNIKELATLTNTSAPTITRFCKKISCESFSSMKVALSSIIGAGKDEIEDELLNNVHLYYKEVIEKTKNLIDSDKVYATVDQIKKANRIFIYGVGNSGLTGDEFKLRLLRMGFNVNSISDTHMMLINSSIASKGDIVIGLSVSGETEEIYQALKLGKKNGAKIITITADESSKMSKISDINLLTYNSLFLNKAKFINSQFSTIYAIDIISTVLLMNKNYENKMKITVDALIESVENHVK